MRFIDQAEVRRRLTYERCIPLVRDAMIALSNGTSRQLLRSIITLSPGRLYGVMSGALGERAPFGSKLVSAFRSGAGEDRPSHQGLLVLFDPETGAPVCTVHAGEVTAIRTAAASAVATDALARRGARRLALLGYGVQAESHARAISQVRKLDAITVWGRSTERARAFAGRMGAELRIPLSAQPTARDAVAEADIICTVSAAAEPILQGAWVKPGTHVNIVGSSYAGPVEVDDALVVRSRFVADSRESVLRQGAEFLKARNAGLIGDGHIVAEIGEVLAGRVPGRRDENEITAYKSLGHIVQDLASAWVLYSQA